MISAFCVGEELKLQGEALGDWDRIRVWRTSLQNTKPRETRTMGMWSRGVVNDSAGPRSAQ